MKKKEKKFVVLYDGAAMVLDWWQWRLGWSSLMVGVDDFQLFFH
jgi:hypothetical protein